jgi:hypothetical protein
MTLPAKVLPRNLAAPLSPRPRVTPRVAVNGSVAPICPVSKSQAVPGSPGVLLPLPPRAVDLPTTIMAVNQLIGLMNIFINVPVHINTNLFNQAPLLKPNWVETGRKMTTTRVYNPDDKSMWVDVEHIAQLTMTDKVLGQSMVLNYAAPKLGGVGTGPSGVAGGQTPGT